MYLKTNLFALFLLFLALSCSKQQACIENCPEEICLISDGKVQIEVSKADQYDFYSHCLKSNIRNESEFNVSDLEDQGRTSQDFYIYLTKQEDFSWITLEGKTFSFEDYAEVDGKVGFSSIFLRWHGKDRYGLDTDLVLDRKTKHTITFTNIYEILGRTEFKIKCTGKAKDENNRLYPFQAELEVFIY